MKKLGKNDCRQRDFLIDAGQTKLNMNKPKRINLAYLFVLLGAFCLFIGRVPGVNLRSLVGRALLGAPFILGGSIGILGLLLVKRIYLSRITKTIVIVSLLVFFDGVLTIPVSWAHFNVIYPVYVIGDAASILWLCSAVIAFGVIKNKNEISFRKIYIFYLFLATVLLISWIASGLFHHRLATVPSVAFCFVLSGIVGYFIFSQKRAHIIFFYSILSFVLLVFSLFGWSRSAFLGFFCCFATACLIILKASRFKSWLYILCVLLMGVTLYYSVVASRITSTRFYEAIDSPYGVGGQSVHDRFCEAINVLYTISDLWPSALTGFGHGSAYTYYPDRVNLGTIIQNLTQDGLVHNIHIGPLLLFFRYGIIGLILYIIFIVVLIKGFFFAKYLYNEITALKINGNYFSVKLFYINYFIYMFLLFRFHIANSLVEPLFGLSLAITTMFISRPHLLRQTEIMA